MEDILSYIADLGYQIWEWFGVEDNRNRSTAIATVFGALAILIGVAWSFIKFCLKPAASKNNSKLKSTAPNTIALTPEQFAENNAALLITAEAKLKSAHDAEKTQLQQQIKELHNRAAHPEQALKDAKSTIAKLEDALTREGNEFGETRMAEAREALEVGDFSIADDIFAEIEAREQLAVERAARAAFARGEIAEQEIRWNDAYTHYCRATALNPTSGNLAKADKFAWHAGRNPPRLCYLPQQSGRTLPRHRPIRSGRTALSASQRNYQKHIGQNSSRVCSSPQQSSRTLPQDRPIRSG